MIAPASEAEAAGLTPVRRYLRELTAGSRGRVTLTVALALAVAVTEGIGLLLLLPLLEIAGVTVSGDVAGNLVRDVRLRLGLIGVPATALVVLGLYVAVMTMRALLVRSSVLASVRLQERFLLSRRQRLYRAMLESRWESVAGHRAGALVHSLTGDLEDAADAPSHLLALLTGGLLALVYLAVAFRLSAAVTMLGVLGGVVLLLVLRRRRHAARRAAMDVHALTAELFAAAAEHVDGLKTTKAYGAERHSERRFAAESSAVASANERCERLFADARTLLDAGAVVVLAVSIYVAHDMMNLGAAAILVLLYIFARVTPRLAGLQSAYQQLMLAMPPFVRVARAIDRWEASAEGSDADGASLRLRRAIVLRGVRYRHPEADVLPSPVETTRSPRLPALRDLTLTIAAGTTTAIVGASGAGKSTLADVVLGLLFAQEGHVEVDGIELTPARARAWRERVGYVAQDTFLFNDTVRANLSWGRPDATDEDIRGALALAAAEEFVDAMPDGLDTVVGERGCRLSCGERQRLTLARALLRRPELLMLDEATSNVDGENEREIQRAVETLRGRMTMLVITHRLATTRAADVIYVMESGRVVESGNFDSLVRRGGRFAALCRAQGLTSAVDSPAQHLYQAVAAR
ncbi:MAG TPA: ABC transporter ATP-binding protein [Gemmatimonadaceae bacterium]|nr:ABC transporter ATP-binding protein [Gemmatimonadaceae bacterium]